MPLTHSQVSHYTWCTYASLEVDQYGHAISGSGVLTPGQVPGLDASKITTGEFGTAFIADNAITLAKLADYSISFIQEAEPSVQHPGFAHWCALAAAINSTAADVRRQRLEPYWLRAAVTRQPEILWNDQR